MKITKSSVSETNVLLKPVTSPSEASLVNTCTKATVDQKQHANSAAKPMPKESITAQTPGLTDGAQPRCYMWDKKSQVTYFCLSCDYRCENNYSLLEKHYKIRHKNKQPESLPIHPNNRNNFDPIIRRADGLLNLECPLCHYQSSMHTDYRAHWRKHLVDLWKCGICETYKAPDKQYVLAHCRTEHEGVISLVLKNVNTDATTPAVQVEFNKPDSPRSFTSNVSNVGDVSTEPTGDSAEHTTNNVPYRCLEDGSVGCTKCDFVDQEKNVMKRHFILKHQPRYFCKDCKHQCRYESDMIRHCNSKHHSYHDLNTDECRESTTSERSAKRLHSSSADDSESLSSTTELLVSNPRKRKRKRIVSPSDSSDDDKDFVPSSSDCSGYESSDSYERPSRQKRKPRKLVIRQPNDRSQPTPHSRIPLTHGQTRVMAKRVNETNLQYFCCYCCETTTTEYELALHLHKHLKLYESLPDKENFDDKRDLNTVKRLSESHKHPYLCENCGKSFFNLKTAKAHSVNTHRGISKIICRVFKDGKPLNERRMLSFDEYATWDDYIDYNPRPFDESEQELLPNFASLEICHLHPCVVLQHLKNDGPQNGDLT